MAFQRTLLIIHSGPPDMFRLTLRPGINREATAYANSGGWFDCNLVRFRQGFPEIFGGWQRFTSEAMLGTGRNIWPWVSLAGERFYAIGTNLKYYQIRGGVPIDVTPIRRTQTLGTDPIEIISNDGTDTLVRLTDNNHGAFVNDYVTFSGVVGPIGGLDASVFNAEHQIIDIIDDNEYEIEVTGVGSPATGGGNAVEAAYQVNTGLNDTVLGAGWGTDSWNSGAWGEASDDLTVADRLRIWHEDNFGEDLIFNIRDGAIFYKDLSTGITARGVELQSVPGANEVPVIGRQVLVSDVDRHVLLFGTNPVNSTVQDPLLVRWSDQEDPFNWEITTTTTAGELRIESGSEIIRAIESRGEILVFTDATVHSLRFVGDPDVFGQTRIGTNVSLIGPNAVTTDGVSVFWMSRGGFYRHTGQIQELRCDIKDFVFENVNISQSGKIASGINRLHSEVIWFMPWQQAEENNFYVVYNYELDIWYYGFIPRTAWVDARYESTPLAVSPDGFLYAHEVGVNDNSQVPPVPLNAYLESSDMELGTGDEFIYIRRLLPDITFVGSTAPDPRVTIQMEVRNYQGDEYADQERPDIARVTAGPPEQYNGVIDDVRMRGRYMRYRIESNQLGVRWRSGIPKLQVQPDGRR